MKHPRKTRLNTQRELCALAKLVLSLTEFLEALSPCGFGKEYGLLCLYVLTMLLNVHGASVTHQRIKTLAALPNSATRWRHAPVGGFL